MTPIRHALLCFGAFLALASPTWPSNGQIGLFFDPSGSKCVGSIGCSGFGTLYVVAILEGASEGGITGAEYGIQIGPDMGPDAGWTFAEEFTSEASVVLGSAFNPPDIATHQFPFILGRGVNVAFPECVRGEGGRVLLEEVAVANPACSGDPLPLLVVKHDYFSHWSFLCPLFTLCDAPSYTKICLGDDLHPCRNPRIPFDPGSSCSTTGAHQSAPRAVGTLPPRGSRIPELDFDEAALPELGSGKLQLTRRATGRAVRLAGASCVAALTDTGSSRFPRIVFLRPS